MQTFRQWLAELNETYYGFDPKEYNELFDQVLDKVISRTSDAKHRQALERMRGFNWMAYIGAAVRNSGCRDQREIQEKAHEIAVKLLMGTLFKGFDERTSGPFDLRFKRSVGNAVRNIVEKERNRRHYLPTVPIDRQCEPGRVTGDDDGSGEKVINDFRRLVKRRLGEIGLAVLDTRLGGAETKSLVGSPALGSPGRWVIKRTVGQIKELAREYAETLDDPELLRRIEKAMAAESETIGKRMAATAAAKRQRVGV